MNRPWEPLGMTTADWRCIPLVRVELATLIPTHDVKDEWVWAKAHNPSSSWCGDPIIHIVRWEGALYISDGHHRVAYLLTCGKKATWARVVCAPQVSGAAASTDPVQRGGAAAAPPGPY